MYSKPLFYHSHILHFPQCYGFFVWFWQNAHKMMFPGIYTICRWSTQKRKIGVVLYVFACHENVQYIMTEVKKKRVLLFALDLFCIYVIRSQHKQYWGYMSAGMWHRVVRWMFPKMSGATRPMTQPHILESSSTVLWEPQILWQYGLHKYSRKHGRCNLNFCIAVRNDHSDHKVCVSNTVPSALHIVIIKTTVYDTFCLQAYGGIMHCKHKTSA